MTKTLDETKVVEMEETMEAEVEEVKESKIKGFASKAVGGVKKHGKKVAKGAALFAGGLVLGALANRGKSGDKDDCGCDDLSVEPVDMNFVEVNETTTE